jgi:hypothetical protein
MGFGFPSDRFDGAGGLFNSIEQCNLNSRKMNIKHFLGKKPVDSLGIHSYFYGSVPFIDYLDACRILPGGLNL